MSSDDGDWVGRGSFHQPTPQELHVDTLTKMIEDHNLDSLTTNVKAAVNRAAQASKYKAYTNVAELRKYGLISEAQHKTMIDILDGIDADAQVQIEIKTTSNSKSKEKGKAKKVDPPASTYSESTCSDDEQIHTPSSCASKIRKDTGGSAKEDAAFSTELKQRLNRLEQCMRGLEKKTAQIKSWSSGATDARLKSVLSFNSGLPPYYDWNSAVSDTGSQGGTTFGNTPVYLTNPLARRYDGGNVPEVIAQKIGKRYGGRRGGKRAGDRDGGQARKTASKVATTAGNTWDMGFQKPVKAMPREDSAGGW